VGFWENGEFVVENYLTGKQTQISPLVNHFLQRIDDYQDREEVMRQFRSVPGAAAVLDRLIAQDVLVLKGSPTDLKDKMLDESWAWGHDARFFHYSSRRIAYEEDLATQRANLAKRASTSPPPPPFKSYGNSVKKLPTDPSETCGEFWRTLEFRRTRRRFSGSPITLSEFSTVLFWTWGCTRIIEDSALGPYVLKTSPSGGARHAIEVYPAVLRVEGLEPGLYHYGVKDHSLHGLRMGNLQTDVLALCSNQPWIRDVAAVFFMTAVLERTMWKYRQSLAYRVLCLDAGHLGQTFHLVCTRLSLAPFTTAATDDEGIERLLNLDGISEVPIYTAAVGHL
jgi:SagB-type dehydrogenase family enzyme